MCEFNIQNQNSPHIPMLPSNVLYFDKLLGIGVM